MSGPLNGIPAAALMPSELEQRLARADEARRIVTGWVNVFKDSGQSCIKVTLQCNQDGGTGLLVGKIVEELDAQGYVLVSHCEFPIGQMHAPAGTQPVLVLLLSLIIRTKTGAAPSRIVLG